MVVEGLLLQDVVKMFEKVVVNQRERERGLVSKLGEVEFCSPIRSISAVI